MDKPLMYQLSRQCIEGYPFIIRFKTYNFIKVITHILGIEGYPFIIRFKTQQVPFHHILLLLDKY